MAGTLGPHGRVARSTRSTATWCYFIACLLCISAAAAPSQRPSTTVYVGRHFEVRDDDAPVKYVFQGETRVARVTGSLAANERIQRLRLRTGWNLVSLAVTAPNFLGQLQELTSGPVPKIHSLYRWQPATKDYGTIAPGEVVAAGTVLWVAARTDTVVALRGGYLEPNEWRAPAGGTFVGTPALAVQTLQSSPGATIWRFEAGSGRWQAGFAGDLSAVSDLPPHLAPGEAIYVHTGAPVELAAPDNAGRIVYYHQDHLSSSSLLTDAAGEVVEETAYYPFGAARHQDRLRQIEAHYGFTQKERDAETGLQDFGQRYYHPGIGKWISPDPLGEKGGGRNPYAYVNQSPLKHNDPDGAEIKVTEVVDKKTRTTTYEIKWKGALLDVSSDKMAQKDLEAFKAKLKSTIEQSYSGQASGKDKDKNWNYKWSASADLRVINDWKDVQKDDHVIRIVDRTKTGARGESAIGGMLIDLKASIFKRTGSSPDETGAHEVGHTGGLEHDNRSPNLMMEGGLRPDGVRKISLEQIQTISQSSKAGKLNQRDKVMGELDDIAKRR